MPVFKIAELESMPLAIREQTEKVALQSYQVMMIIDLEKAHLKIFKDLSRLAISDSLCQKLLPIAMKRRPVFVTVMKGRFLGWIPY